MLRLDSFRAVIIYCLVLNALMETTMNYSTTAQKHKNVFKSKFYQSILLSLSSLFFLQSLNAAPLIKNDLVFTQSTLIGTVFFDSNLNGYLDKGENGIPAVRLVTVEGLVIKTDGYGRFHIPDGLINKTSYGQNQLLKVDFYSLPEGSRFTTENPRLIRNSNAGLNKINFGIVF